MILRLFYSIIMVYIILSMDAITMTMTPIVIAVIVGEEGDRIEVLI